MGQSRNVYLKMKNLAEARKIVDEAFALPDALASEISRMERGRNRELEKTIFSGFGSRR